MESEKKEEKEQRKTYTVTVTQAMVCKLLAIYAVVVTFICCFLVVYFMVIRPEKSASQNQCPQEEVINTHLTNRSETPNVLGQDSCPAQACTFPMCAFEEKWIAMRATPNCGLNIRDTWMSTSSHGDTTLQNLNPSIPGLYKSPLVDSSWHLVTKVKYALYKEGKEVASFTFNAVGLDKASWFSDVHLIEARPYTDISCTSRLIFSIPGCEPNCDTLASWQRHFFIQHTYGGCNVDEGWTVISDLGAADPCQWANKYANERPVFLYSPTNTKVHENDFVKADLMAILVEMWED